MSDCCMANKILKMIRDELSDLEKASRFKWETSEYYNKVDIQISTLEDIVEKIENKLKD